MKKIIRFSIVAAIFVAMLVLLYSVLPFIVWIFGGSFQAVSQHPIYVLVFLVIAVPFQSILFGECFDGDFYEKKRH